MRSATPNAAFVANVFMQTASSTSSIPLPQSPPTAARSRRWLSRRWAPYVFISPFFILFAVFGLYPLLFSAWVSFFQWDGIGEMRFEGLGNFVWVLDLGDLPWGQFFTVDFWTELYSRDFWRALYNTLWIGLVAGVPQHLMAIPLAYFIHTKLKRLSNPVLALYFLPFITNTVAIALVFQALFSAQFGVVNNILVSLGTWQVGGVAPLGWLFPSVGIDWASPEMTRWIVAFLVWWRYVGWNTVLYLAALQTIPQDLYEAARIDGASSWQRFRYITVPMLKPMMFFAITLTLIGNLQLFEEPYILTGSTGGVGRVAETSAMYMLKVGMSDGDFGSASAVAWLLFMFIAAMTYLNNRIFKPKD
jgi:multiple sugar transport system permease protein